MQTMQAYRITDWQSAPRFEEVAVPQPGPGEVRIKVAGNGLCHSDIGMTQMPRELCVSMGWRVPFTLGHEIGGWVESCGSGVRSVRAGDPVVLSAATSDGSCEFCLRGQDSACIAGTAGRGYGRDGGLAAYVIAPEREVLKLGSLDPATAGPLSDAAATAYHAVKRVLPKLRPGSSAIVIGAGGLGSFAVQFLRVLSPAQVIAVDTSAQRLAFAAELGAHRTLTGVDEGTSASLRELTQGRGAMVVLDFVGIDATITAGIAAVRRTGSFGLIGAGMGGFTGPAFHLLPRDGEVFGFQGANLSDLREVVELVEAGLVRNEVERYPLSRVAEAYEKLDQGGLRGRAVIVPD